MSAPPVTLDNCDREPIHIPGSIQPQGCLLACDDAAGNVLRHSANAAAMLALAEDPNGRTLDEVVGTQNAHTVRNALARVADPGRAALSFGLVLPSGAAFDVAAHRFDDTAIVELEPAASEKTSALELARTMIGRVTAIDRSDRLIRETARLVQATLGYDRVMVYSFDADGSGKVVSEAKRSDLESFLGQYFPASDIPAPARTLYLRNPIRLIADVDYQPVPVMPELDAAGRPLDLSFAHLRSVSPVHCEYLRNMGVTASMSISVIIDGALWGLIACHHYSARRLSMADRVAAEMFGQYFSLHLDALRRKQKLDAATRARQLLDQFLRTAAETGSVDELLGGDLADFAALVPCDGLGFWLNGAWRSHGATPPAAALPALAERMAEVADGRVWATNRLSAQFPEAASYADVSSGLLAIPLSQRPRDYLFFFRKELLQTLDWAGNPEKVYRSGPLGDRLTPRTSFAIWKQTVRHQADPWTEAQIEIAEATRVALVEIILRHNELLADERAKTELRRRILNEELNHRVKNILAVISSIVALPNKESETIEGYVATLRGRIRAIAYAHDQVVRADGGGGLADLIGAELTAFESSGAAIVADGPAVRLDARAFSVLALVLHELATNAAKYGSLSRDGGRLTIGWRLDGGGACVIEWRESGGPPVRAPERPGFGTLLIDRSIRFDLGGEVTIGHEADGLSVTLRIPAGFVTRGIASAAPAKPRSAPPQATAAPDLQGKRVLLVEDQLLIAMDLERILDTQGPRGIDTVASVTEALERLEKVCPDLAILDVNLGGETSALIADELTRRRIPFAFATGYSDRSLIPERFGAAPVIRKPFDATDVIGQVAELLRDVGQPAR
ncbi:MAG: HWE histidine kinase domain-containing protein [Geminicoccaceae bacterium]